MRRSLASKVALVLVAIHAPAFAQDSHAAAVELFDAGEALSKSGHLAEACAKYGESYRLDPQLGALLHYADCLEQSGKLAGAYATFRDAAELAEQRGDERKGMAEARASALESRLTRIAVVLASDAQVPGLEVFRDGIVLSPASLGTPIAVDAGEHRIEARAPGYATWSTPVVVAGEGNVKHVIVPALARAPAAAPGGPVVPAPPAADQSPRHKDSGGGPSTLTWVAGGVAVVGLASGVVFNVLARGANTDAQSQCLPHSTSGSCAVLNASHGQERQDSLDIASMDRTISYVALGVGGAAAVVAVVSLLVPGSGKSSASVTKPDQRSVKLDPQLSQAGGGLLVRGSF